MLTNEIKSKGNKIFYIEPRLTLYCLEMAGGSSHCAGENGQPGVGRPLGAGHLPLRDPGPTGRPPHSVQQENCQREARGRLQSGHNRTFSDNHDSHKNVAHENQQTNT